MEKRERQRQRRGRQDKRRRTRNQQPADFVCRKSQVAGRKSQLAKCKVQSPVQFSFVAAVASKKEVARLVGHW